MTRWVVVVAVLLGGAALAEEPKVEVTADVIHASNAGNASDPALSAVKDEFASAGFPFSSYKRLSSQKLPLTKAKPAELKLPNGKTAVLELEDIKAGTALVKVNVGGTKVGLQLGREGSVFVGAGAHGNGQLILMLSPGASKRPRRAPAGAHPASAVGVPARK
ncbi:MAG: hypothetical protein ACYC8T_38540 [Myxococcaceae bacterium]